MFGGWDKPLLSEGLFYMRCWVGLVGAVAVFTGARCYISQTYTADNIYTLRRKEASSLFTRMFGNWTLLAGIIRVTFALSVPTLSLYFLTLFSFLLALGHFTYEVWVSKSAPLGIATVSPLCIAGGSALWMMLGLLV